ncbi:MAG TPA: LysR substrate-binding domain-containing protein [Chloroflexia bacterium]|nr:LysR substrate-binding domain-containing protein [Chloroflexia bacterium]
MVNLYQLQIFVTVSERGTFSAAAEVFNLTQPGVSQHIRALEDAYKVKLFNRNGPRIELTEAGQRLLEAARPLVEQAERLEETFSASLGEVRGRVSLTYSKNTAGALYTMLPLLAGFHQRHSNVRFSLVQFSEEESINKLLERETNFALLTGPSRQKSLESMLLYSDELVLALPPGHPWHNTQVTLNDLKNQPFLLRAPGSETRRLTENTLRVTGLNLNTLKVVAELDSAEGVVLAAQAGLGMGFVASAIARRFAVNGQISCARLRLTEREISAGIDLKREFYLTRLAPLLSQERSPSQEQLWEYFKLAPQLIPNSLGLNNSTAPANGAEKLHSLPG